MTTSVKEYINSRNETLKGRHERQLSSAHEGLTEQQLLHEQEKPRRQAKLIELEEQHLVWVAWDFYQLAKKCRAPRQHVPGLGTFVAVWFLALWYSYSERTGGSVVASQEFRTYVHKTMKDEKELVLLMLELQLQGASKVTGLINADYMVDRWLQAHLDK